MNIQSAIMESIEKGVGLFALATKPVRVPEFWLFLGRLMDWFSWLLRWIGAPFQIPLAVFLPISLMRSRVLWSRMSLQEKFIGAGIVGVASLVGAFVGKLKQKGSHGVRE